MQGEERHEKNQHQREETERAEESQGERAKGGRAEAQDDLNKWSWESPSAAEKWEDKGWYTGGRSSWQGAGWKRDSWEKGWQTSGWKRGRWEDSSGQLVQGRGSTADSPQPKGVDHKKFYELLGLNRYTATQSEVTKAFHAVAKRSHPDKVPEPGSAQQASEYWFKQVNAAYVVLGDPVTRAAYDAECGHETVVELERRREEDERRQRQQREEERKRETEQLLTALREEQAWQVVKSQSTGGSCYFRKADGHVQWQSWRLGVVKDPKSCKHCQKVAEEEEEREKVRQTEAKNKQAMAWKDVQEKLREKAKAKAEQEKKKRQEEEQLKEEERQRVRAASGQEGGSRENTQEKKK